MDAPATAYRTERFELRPAQRQLWVGGSPAKIGARAFDLLLALVERRQQHVAKAELLKLVWPGQVVEENNLEVHVWALRRLLGHDVIATIPGRGYRFVAPLRDADEPAPPARALPSVLTPLVGRAAELSALREALATQTMVTVAGAGGFGKTLLARYVVQAEGGLHPAGACWVELAPLPAGADVAADVAVAIAAVLKLPVPMASGPDGIAAWTATWGSRPLLLALDDCDAHAEAVAHLVQTLRAHAPGLRVLLTAQRPLHVEGEHVFRLGPLASPPVDTPAEAAQAFGAVALFVDRVRALNSRFELDASNVRAVIEVGQRLDGNALAIELAAARVPLMGVQGLAAALDQRLGLLTQGWRGGPVRQHSLRAMLAWSHGLLSADEQTVFRRLAVFRGGCSLELAHAVVADARLKDWPVLNAMDALVDRSLVAVSSTDPPRYRMLESAQALAAEQLQASGEQAEVERRFAHAVTQRLLALSDAAREGKLLGADLMVHIGPDLDNARAAMAWALQHDGTLAVMLATPLSNGLGWNHHAEGLQMFESSQRCLHDALPPALRLRWLVGAAGYFNLHSPARALPLAREAVALARSANEPARLARALGVVATAFGVASAEERAVALDEMVALDRPDWAPVIRIHVAFAEFRTAFERGDLARAERALQRWLALADPESNSAARTVAMNNLAELLLARGAYDEAAALARELEQQGLAAGELRRVARARLLLCLAALNGQQMAEARAMAQLGWPMSALGPFQADWLPMLAELALAEARPRAAARLLGALKGRWTEPATDSPLPLPQAFRRATAQARAALGELPFELQRQLGGGLSDAVIGSLAFDVRDID